METSLHIDISALAQAMKDLARRKNAAWKPRQVAALPIADGFRLSDVERDGATCLHCGQAAMAALTGEPVAVIKDAIRTVRYSSIWVTRDRTPDIGSIYAYDIVHGLRLLGYHGEETDIPARPTLAQFLKTREGDMRRYPCIVGVTRGFFALAGEQACDISTDGVVVDAEELPGKRQRVRWVYAITRYSPRFGAIPSRRKARPADPAMDRLRFLRFLGNVGATHQLGTSRRGRKMIEIRFGDDECLTLPFDGRHHAHEAFAAYLNDPEAHDAAAGPRRQAAS